jgi:hypothetical protein
MNMLSGLFLMCGQMIKAIDDNLQLVLDGYQAVWVGAAWSIRGDGTLPAL